MNRRSTSTALTLLSLIFAVSISSRARSAQVGELEKLNVCYSSIAATSITTWVPHEAGFYKKYGLDVSIIYVAGAQAIATLVSGDTQIVQGSGAAAALSRLSGSDATVIGMHLLNQQADVGVLSHVTQDCSPTYLNCQL